MTDEAGRLPAHDPLDDPARDPALASALRDLGPEPPMEAVDWDRLERAVAARARRQFGSRRPGAAWWQPVAAWARPAIPLALAAGIALLLAVLRLSPGTAEPTELLLLGDEVAVSVYLDDPAFLLRAAFTSEDRVP